jgi:sugar-specific transcriptional regulator TrmB
MDTEILKDVGLTPSEIKTYISLLEQGASHAGKIIEDTDLQSSVTHRALLSLIKKGLVSYVNEGRHKVYSATEPVNFLAYIDEKRKRLEAILPELRLRQQVHKKSAVTSMYKGRKGIHEVYTKLISMKNREMLTFGGSTETAEFMTLAWWKNMHLRRVENRVVNRHIASDEVMPYAGYFLKLKRTKMKFLPKESFSQYQETAIIGDYVAVTIFADEGYCILIYNRDVADGYRKNFEILWRLAKEKK